MNYRLFSLCGLVVWGYVGATVAFTESAAVIACNEADVSCHAIPIEAQEEKENSAVRMELLQITQKRKQDEPKNSMKKEGKNSRKENEANRSIIKTSNLALLASAQSSRKQHAANKSMSKTRPPLFHLYQTAHVHDVQTLKSSISAQVEYELYGETETRSKVLLVLLELLGLGFCLGLDRCFMGQPCCGCVKCLTCGGCLFWGVLDYLLVIINCLASAETLTSLGWNVTFAPDETVVAFWICISVIAFKICSCVYVQAVYAVTIHSVLQTFDPEKFKPFRSKI